MKQQRWSRKIYLDSLPERIKEEVLQDRIGVREETVCGLEPRRWAQIAEMFQGESSADALYCLGRGLNTYAAAAYLGTSERTIRNTANRYLNKLMAIQKGVCAIQTQMFDQIDDADFQFAPDRRAPTRRGRPRTKTPREEMDMCY